MDDDQDDSDRRFTGVQPGTKSKHLIERDARVFMHQINSTPVAHALSRLEPGVWAVDADGRRFMDFHGNTCHNIGYCHLRLIAAINEQLQELPFAPRCFTNEPAVALAEKLVEIWPYGKARVLFGLSGSDAVEMAVKLAYIKTGRQTTLAFEDSWHGAGLGAVSIGGRAWERDGFPLLPGCFHVPAYWRPVAGEDPMPEALDRAAQLSLASIARSFRDQGGFAAFLAEPIKTIPHQAPEWFWPEVRSLCDRYETLLIFDEIPSGLGKTGRYFASERVDARPDITVLGKSLGGGVVPLSAVIARDDLNVAGDLAIGHYTHQKSPLLARAGLETLRIIEDEGLVARAARLGEKYLPKLARLAEEYSLLAGARGLGLLMSIEFDSISRSTTDVERALRATQAAAMRRGLNVATSDDRFLVLSPPLVVSEVEMDLAIDILRAALAATERSYF